MLQYQNQLDLLTVCEFFINIRIDRSYIQCGVMCHLQTNAHKVLRVFLWSLIHSSPLSCMVFILEKKKIQENKTKQKNEQTNKKPNQERKTDKKTLQCSLVILSLDSKTRISNKV